MTTTVIEIEGTWEQIAPQALRFPKRKMRLTILPEDMNGEPTEAGSQPHQFATAWEYLQSLPPRHHTLEEWESIERDIQAEKDAWGN